MNNIGNKKIRFIVISGVIAALYVIMTMIFKPISMGEIQCRIAEILCILPIFTPAAVPGLVIGCVLGNLLGGAIMLDVIVGSFATFLGAIGTYLLRKKPYYIALIPPILSNTIIIPFVLRYGYNVPLPIYLLMVYLFVGEFVSIGILGSIFYRVLKKSASFIFE